MDPKEEKRILQLLREVPIENVFIGDQFNSDLDDMLEESEHDTNSEHSGDESNEDRPYRRHRREFIDPAVHQGSGLPPVAVSQARRPLILGKDNTTVWYTHPKQQNVRAACQNIVIRLPGVKGVARNADAPIKSWNLFFPETIVTHTKQWIEDHRVNFSREKDVFPTNVAEIKAVLGLLYIKGALQSSHLNLEDLYAEDGTRVQFFRNVMSQRRFRFLLTAMRFDYNRTRDVCTNLDKLAAIREVFQQFNEQCNSHYSVGAYITIDEMLEPFRGRCGFKQYIKSKPARYGIKIFSLAVTRVCYALNMEIYGAISS
uniref:PiggyBac transposable element-derived protein domain-containing protein n=1 Tax=Homalodisca liturata TaxID=320908 RepID=A0A1B6I510_9HEMI